MLVSSAEIARHMPDGFYIDGRWKQSASGRVRDIVSPSTEEAIFATPLATADEIDDAIKAARRAFDEGPWPRMSPQKRSELMHLLADALSARLPLLTRAWTAQVGAPISLAARLAPLGCDRLRYFADLAKTFEFDHKRGHARIIEEPVGVAALIVPWNAAYPILMNKLGAALAAGCTCIIKPSPESPLEAVLVAECADEVGFPSGVINVILADAAESALLAASPAVEKVSFTGSVAAGSKIASIVGARIGRVTLELGGKSAAILLDDIELEKALPALSPFIMPFSGQFCFSQTRLLVPRGREHEIVAACAKTIEQLKVGDPWDASTALGPVLNRRQFGRIMGYIDQSLADGACVVTGGRRSTCSNTGYYIEPTLFSDVSRDMSIAREEIFGPVVVIQIYDTVEEAIAIANDSDFGLSGSVFGKDIEKAVSVATKIRSGQIGINGLRMSPEMPFGGFKMSGFGREGGPEGLRGFLETKAILSAYPPE